MVKPKSVIRLLRANEAIFLSSVSLLLCYNGPHCALKAAKYLCKNKTIIIITLMTDLG